MIFPSRQVKRPLGVGDRVTLQGWANWPKGARRKHVARERLLDGAGLVWELVCVEFHGWYGVFETLGSVSIN